MTNRQRMLAVIAEDTPDRVPFVQYDGISAPNAEVWSVIGRDNMGVLRWCAAHRLEHPNCRLDREQMAVDGQPGWRETLTTPAGQLTQEKLLVPGMGQVSGFHKHYVSSVDDVHIFMSYLRDTVVLDDATTIRRAQQELGDDGLPHINLGRTPFQALWIEWISILDLSLYLADAPELVAECLELLGGITRRIAEAAWRAADQVHIPYVVFGDNITAPLIGEERFHTHCVTYYRDVSAMMADKGVPLFVHMDGDLKPIWTAIADSGVHGIDSLSPPPDNDTSVADALEMWPDMRLLVNFPSSVHLAAPEAVYRQACTILAAGADTGRLQIQISENTPPGAWRTSYPAIVRAIQDVNC